jgi:hypothetical protein
MMHREVTAIVLCILAQAATAQCVAPAADAQPHAAAAVQTVRAPAATQQKAHAELIQTAAAGTRDDDPPVIHEGSRHRAGTQDHPRRGGTAMLLAALALMSGIALRRFGHQNNT